MPGALFVFIGLHLTFFRKAGPAGPPKPDASNLQGRSETFYPRQLAMDAAFALLLVVVLAALAHFVPKALGPEVNPADTQFIPRPEWYYRPVFQWLKYWEGPLAVVGILVVPGILAVLLAGLPFYDRRPERRPWRRPIAASTFSVVLVGLIALGIISYRVDMSDPPVAAQLRRQDELEQEFMRQPFRPETPPPLPASQAAPAPANPLTAQGKQIFESKGCVACHGQGGVGTAMAVKLIGVGLKLAPEQLAALIRHPTARMKTGGMPDFPLSDDDMKALIAYLESLK